MQSLYDVSYWIKCGKCDDKISVSNETLPAIVLFFLFIFMNRYEQNNRNLSIAANEYKTVCTWLIDVIWMQITCSYIQLYVCIINADVVDFVIIFFWIFHLNIDLWKYIQIYDHLFLPIEWASQRFFPYIIIFVLFQSLPFTSPFIKIFYVDSVNSKIMGCLFTYNEVHRVH